MSVEPVPAPRPIPWSLVPLTPALSCAVLGAGVAGLLPQLVAVGVAVGLATLVHATLLIRLALAIPRQRHNFRPCRGAGFLGKGVLATRVSVAGGRARRDGGAADRRGGRP